MKLRQPTLEDEDAILEMIAEFDAAKSYMHGGMGSTWKRAKDYEDWLKIVERKEDVANLPAGWVPAIQFLSFDETGLPLGFLALRLSLNDKLFVEGGHIGYSIRPSQRRKGLAKLQLELGLAEARKQGLERVLITCDEDNEASRRTILSAGGVYENTIDRSQRYWIDLEDEDEQSQTSRMEK
ncbi:GNAT family N-acetyltransferase [Streptococcus cristatus]|uniref:GNAT family N-acetyltransferase n=1 Tax=Streptococcus cristatus TaxID=45634 RepID=UPI0011F1A38D|nr:GNAT family N-acetyltransferase [Streptococcus cristatus]